MARAKGRKAAKEQLTANTQKAQKESRAGAGFKPALFFCAPIGVRNVNHPGL